MNERPRAIVFDWDNTLVDTWETTHQALNMALIAMGHTPWTLAEHKARVRLSLRDSFSVMFKERWEEARKIYLDAFLAVHLERLTALPGIVELLDELQGRGYYLAVVSNKTGSILRREAEHLGWSRYFGRIVGATDAAADKPDAAPVHLALTGSGIAAGRDVWLVGDTAIDMQCALNAGCRPVLLGAADPTAPEFAKYKPDLVFGDSAALFLHIRTL